ncbi:MAG: hypothetical protein LHW64_08800 [Candidatus Cloacimonetes bacterium]|nr:hypothetical protein [Candidatus Cloacimonadota bacterium]MDY0230213.1 hypothetical protein [Candidatus Cloacimonadaceae bacterium]
MIGLLIFCSISLCRYYDVIYLGGWILSSFLSFEQDLGLAGLQSSRLQSTELVLFLWRLFGKLSLGLLLSLGAFEFGATFEQLFELVSNFL